MKLWTVHQKQNDNSLVLPIGTTRPTNRLCLKVKRFKKPVNEIYSCKNEEPVRNRYYLLYESPKELDYYYVDLSSIVSVEIGESHNYLPFTIRPPSASKYIKVELSIGERQFVKNACVALWFSDFEVSQQQEKPKSWDTLSV